jgi:hypothetical protein
MADFDAIRFAQLQKTKAQVGDKAPEALNAELAALAAAQATYVEPAENVAMNQVLAAAEIDALRVKATQELESKIGQPLNQADPDEILTAIEAIRSE